MIFNKDLILIYLNQVNGLIITNVFRSSTKPPWRQHSSVFSGHCQTQDVVVSPPLQSSSPRYRLQISARNIVTLAINVTRKKHSNTFKEKTRATDWRTALCSLSFGFRLYTTAITTTTTTTITHLCSPSSSYGCWQELLQSRATLRELSTTSLHSCLAYFDREHRPTVQHLFTFHNSVKEDVLCLYFEYWLFGEGTNPYPKPQ